MDKVLIYDDNINSINELKCILERICPETVIHTSDNYETTIKLMKNNSYSVMFIDIELDNNISGIKFISELNESGNKSSVVFITAHTRYNEEIFYACPTAFIQKPFSEENVGRAVDIVKKRKPENKCIVLTRSVNNIEKINFDRISYIEHINRYTIFYDESFQEISRFYELKLTEVMKLLDDSFSHCHQSYIVNLKYAFKIERFSFTLTGTEKKCSIPVSQMNYKKVHLHYMQFLEQSVQ